MLSRFYWIQSFVWIKIFLCKLLQRDVENFYSLTGKSLPKYIRYQRVGSAFSLQHILTDYLMVLSPETVQKVGDERSLSELSAT